MLGLSRWEKIEWGMVIIKKKDKIDECMEWRVFANMGFKGDCLMNRGGPQNPC